MPRSPRWTDQDLIDAVGRSTTLLEVCELLGIRPGGGTSRSLERHMARLGVDGRHLQARRQPQRTSRRSWSDDDLAEAVRASASISEVSRRLGYRTSGGVHRFITHHVRRLGLDTAHFTGQAWARGLTFTGRRQRPLSEILVERSTYQSTGGLRRRLVSEGLKPAHCETCGRSEWNGIVLPLELDHINGDHTDNRLENLRILCPNCHAVTETWCRTRSKPA